MLCKGYSQVRASASSLVTSWDPRQSCDVSTGDTLELKLEGSLSTEECLLHDKNATTGDERAHLGASCVVCRAVAAHYTWYSG